MIAMKKLKQKKVASLLGISESFLSKILTGKCVGSPEMIKKLSEITDSNPIIWMFGTKDQKINAILNSAMYRETMPDSSEYKGVVVRQ